MKRPFNKVLLVDAGGAPKSWITDMEAAFYAATDSVMWVPPTAVTSKVYGGTNAKTGELSSVDIASIMAVKGPSMQKLMATHSYIPRVNSRAIFMRDGCRCAYCGEYFNVDELTKDHITPKSQGGKNTWQNLISACKPCNSKKADRSLEKAGMKLLYKPYVPSRLEFLYFTNKSISIEQREYLDVYYDKILQRRAAKA